MEPNRVQDEIRSALASTANDDFNAAMSVAMTGTRPFQGRCVFDGACIGKLVLHTLRKWEKKITVS